VTCGGVLVSPGDLVVGDADGVVVVPVALASDVLHVAMEIEETERRMAASIHQTGSILGALKQFARI
jgi:regulator of RNase E activity RraA